MNIEPQPTGVEEKPAAVRRRHDRRSAAITALVHSHGRFQTVSILDFSMGGLQLQGAFGVAAGDVIQIERRDRGSRERGFTAVAAGPHLDDGLRLSAHLAQSVS